MDWIKSSPLFMKFLVLILCLMQCCCDKLIEGDKFVTVLSIKYRDKLFEFDELNFNSFMKCTCNSPIFSCEASFTQYKNQYRVTNTTQKYPNATTPPLPKSKILCSINQDSAYAARLLCTPSGENNCKHKIDLTSPALLENQCVSTCLGVGWNEDAPIVFEFVNISFAIIKDSDSKCEIRNVKIDRLSSTSQITSAMSTNGVTIEKLDSGNDSRDLKKNDITNKTTQEIGSAMSSRDKVAKFNYTFISVCGFLLVVGTIFSLVLNARLKQLLASNITRNQTRINFQTDV